MSTAIQRQFAGGTFTFHLPLSGILAVESGPVTPALRKRDYPVSLFQIYDELSAGMGFDAEGNITRYPGSTIFAGDIHNILEQALRAGKSGERDGQSIVVDSAIANRLVNETLDDHFEACALLAWDVLHSTIKGVALKKKEEPVSRKRQSRSTAAKS